MNTLRKVGPPVCIVAAHLFLLAQGAMLGCDFSVTLPEIPENELNAHACACKCATTIHQVIKVGASFDDAEQTLRADDNDGATDLDLGVVFVGLRFANLAIPPAATIESARVQFTADQGFAGDNTTPLSLTISGEAADNAASFGGNFVNGIATRPRTSAASNVMWNVPAWAPVQDGDAQRTPDLGKIVQEVINRSGWKQGNAMVLFLSGAGGRREAESFDGFADHAPVIEIAYRVYTDQLLNVCMPPELNPNLVDHDPGFPSDQQLKNDCAGRVETTFSHLAMACHYPAACECESEMGSRHFNAACNEPCVEDPLDPSCSNFDPEHGNTTATNVPGDQPVCVTERITVPGTGPAGIAAAVFGKASECHVQGQATIEVADETKVTPARGGIDILGAPCPGEECSVGLAFDLMLDPIEFEVRFHSDPRFENLMASSATTTDAALIGPSGFGMLGAETTQSSLRGERPIFGQLFKKTAAVAGTNPDPVGVFVNWEDHVCSVFGNATAVVDDEGEQQLLAELTVQGSIVNEPPHADAGEDQVIECASPDGARVILDGRGSRDPEDNAVVFAWSADNGIGPPLGNGLLLELQQAVGSSRTAVLRVIDAFGQTDEDDATVAVQDTTAPELSLSASPSVLWPANHKLKPVSVSVTSADACDANVAIRLVSIVSDEGELADGSGHTSPDIQGAAFGTDDREFLLRAERSGSGDGRTYTITYEAEDASGNITVGMTTVFVPKSQS